MSRPFWQTVDNVHGTGSIENMTFTLEVLGHHLVRSKVEGRRVAQYSIASLETFQELVNALVT